jgi:hypothetical protein
MSSGPAPICAPSRLDIVHTRQLQRASVPVPQRRPTRQVRLRKTCGVASIAASRNLGITAGGKRIWALAPKTDRAFKAHPFRGAADAVA